MRLIDAEKLKEKIRSQDWKDDTTLQLALQWIYILIDEEPAIEPKRGEWINVKDRLPEYNPAGTAKAYWVAYDTNKGKHIQIAIYSDYKYATTSEMPPCVTWRDYEYHKIKNVTHWMPLPEPPQEDKP